MGEKTDAFTLILTAGKNTHNLIVLFKKHLRYEGAVHECIVCSQSISTDIQIEYLSSPSKDPNRNMRILEKSDMKCPRNVFYLAKEYMDHQRYDEAIETFYKYLGIAT